MRADARRNYERLLAAAEQAFTEYGADASLDEIARRAGVGSGTLYRHFPTRDALLEAVFGDSVERLCASADELAATLPAQEALVAWLLALVRHTTTFHGLASTLMACSTDESSPLYRSCHSISATMTALLDRAKAAGAVREDLAPGDLGALVHGIAMATEAAPGDPSFPERMLGLTLDGLRPRS
jgi:AcrR family transcriptional regulator